MSETGYNIDIEDEHSTARGGGLCPAYPATDGEHFTLYTDDGDLLAGVSRIDGGYYTCDDDQPDDNTPETGGVRVFNDWRVALFEWAKWHSNCGRPITDAGELAAIQRTIDER